jgi:tetratricopeptide (TPR) repeat protein
VSPARVVLVVAALAAGSTMAAADELVLASGGRIVVDLWWEEGGVLFYETDAGTVGIPRDQVLEIRPGPSATPRVRSVEPPAGRAAADPPPPSDPGTSEELSRLIDQVGTELRRAGSDESRDRLRRGLADLYVRRAREYLSRGIASEATDDYERALAELPDHRIALVELGWLTLRAGERLRSQRLVERGLASYPGDPWLLELRGELHYRDSRLRDALEDFSAAARGRPDEPGPRRRLEKVRRDIAAEHGYERTLSSHFVLRFDGDRDEGIGRAVLESLEHAWDELTRRLDAYPLEPVTVILYTKRQFRETTGSGAEVAGLFDGKIRLPVGGLQSVTPGVERVLRHELTHALVHHKSSANAPRWLHEGLAQLMEPRDPDVASARLYAAGSSPPGLDPFDYGKSLSFCGFLVETRSLDRVLWLIDLLAERQPETDAFERAFGSSRRRMVEEWQRWLQRRD